MRMFNLLKDRLTEDTVAQLLAAAPRRPLLPPFGAIEWRHAAENPVIGRWMKPLRARAEVERAESLPALPDELYAEFHRTGNTLHFGRPYFERRRRLARAAICVLVDGAAAGPGLVDSLIRKLSEIALEDSWALPAHVKTPSGKDPMFIDLFAAETANLMAEMIDVFGALLPGGLRHRVRERLRIQIFENCVNRHAEFWWTKTSSNWNAVCHQGIAGAALTLVDDPKMLARILLQARESLPLYLGGFGEDGACSEGPTYWDYGFGWFSVLNEQLEQRSAGQLSLFAGDEHIRQIARYGPCASLPFFNFVNFADAAPSGILRPSTLAYLGGRLDDENCRLRAQTNYGYLVKNGLELDGERQDFFNFARLFLHCPPDSPGGAERPPGDVYFRNLGVVVSHGCDSKGRWWDFAAKAGHNNEHHNHNDCGSYILNVDGCRLISEIGAPEYVKDFWGGRRYEFLAARTLGHSLPIINGQEQAGGKEFVSSVLACALGESAARFAVDATRCYPAGAECRRFVRHFHFDKVAGRLEVRDEFDLAAPHPVETAIITQAEVVMTRDQAEIKSDGLILRIIPFAGTIVDRIETHPYSAHDGTPAEARRLVLRPAKETACLILGYVAELGR
jgi:hypothetical protein